ncbi:MAG: DNA repair protein RadA [Bacillota bacterium]|jgi:DNA repair protein RadA/Sms
MKHKSIFVCQECGAQSFKWQGRCTACGAWNSMVEEAAQLETADKHKGIMIRSENNVPLPMNHVDLSKVERFKVGIDELDNVLGGGLVPGSFVLLGGEPGIGKSTILLQMALKVSQNKGSVLYVSGEESSAQVRMRAERLGAVSDDLWLLTENNLEMIIHHAQKQKCKLLIVDSIQTVFLPELSAAPGSVSQVRQCGSELLRLAKDTGITVILVGHVTKEGTLAGPRVLEHMVDTVLYFEGERINSLRLLRAIKNRFGSTNELGVFEMSGSGLLPLADPTGVFLSHHESVISGSTVGCALQGTRPVMLEIQALTSPSNFGNPRRLASGIDYNRLLIIIAVLEKKVGLNLSNQDIYLNIIGGLKVDDPAIDLAIAAAIVSSYRELPVPSHTVVLGEIGLTGELRPAGQTARRLAEVKKLGFSTAVIAKEKGAGESGMNLGLTLCQADSLVKALSYMGF